MLGFTLRRLVWLVFVLLGMTLITFAVSHLVPADPAKAAAGENATAEQVERIRRDLGLDRPLHVQYLRYLQHLLTGDLGRSVYTGQPVSQDIRSFFPATFELAVWALLVTVILGIPMGVISATHQDSIVDVLSRVFATIWVGMPQFWFAILLQILFYSKLGWFSAGGRIGAEVIPPTTITGLYSVDSLLTLNFPALLSSLHHLFLPVMTLALARVAVVARLARAGMLEVLSSDFIRTARAKGLAERVVIYRHALKNASLPVLTQIGNQFGFLLGGTVLIEAVFQWPGMGRYAVNAITRVDFNPIIGVALVASLVFVLVNLIVDFLYRYLDPRIAY